MLHTLERSKLDSTEQIDWKRSRYCVTGRVSLLVLADELRWGTASAARCTGAIARWTSTAVVDGVPTTSSAFVWHIDQCVCTWQAQRCLRMCSTCVTCHSAVRTSCLKQVSIRAGCGLGRSQDRHIERRCCTSTAATAQLPHPMRKELSHGCAANTLARNGMHGMTFCTNSLLRISKPSSCALTQDATPVAVQVSYESRAEGERRTRWPGRPSCHVHHAHARRHALKCVRHDYEVCARSLCRAA